MLSEPKRRYQQGSALVLTLVVCGSILFLMALVALCYGQMLGSNYQQTNAIKAAALVAASDLSRIVVFDSNFGYISLGDAPPQGAFVSAPDKYGMTVHSINTIFATIMADLNLASLMNDKNMIAYLTADYQNALEANQRLITHMQKALQTHNYSAKDVYGTSINIYDDVIAALNANPVFLSGSSKIEPSSIKITLGTIKGATSAIPVIDGAQSGTVGVQTANQFYPAYTSVLQNKMKFVFTSTGTQPSLVPDSEFVETPNLPYFTPSVVKVLITQKYSGVGSALHKEYAVASSACAQATAPFTALQEPGFFLFDFPDGSNSQGPLSIVNNSTAQSVRMSVFESVSGDYPQSPAQLKAIQSLPYGLPANPSIAQMLDLSLHDWLFRIGPIIDFNSLINALSSFPPQVVPTANNGSGGTVVFQSNAGLIISTFMSNSLWYGLNSDMQLVAVSSPASVATANGTINDIIISDNIRAPKGLHGGEPLLDSRMALMQPWTQPPPTPSNLLYNNILTEDSPQALNGWAGANGGWAYSTWRSLKRDLDSGGDNTPQALSSIPNAKTPGTIRPTYKSNGIACEFGQHRVIFAVPQHQN